MTVVCVLHGDVAQKPTGTPASIQNLFLQTFVEMVGLVRVYVVFDVTHMTSNICIGNMQRYYKKTSRTVYSVNSGFLPSNFVIYRRYASSNNTCLPNHLNVLPRRVSPEARRGCNWRF